MLADDVALLVISSVSAAISIVVVLLLFAWAAKKDGEEDRALQKRLGIRRKTRL